MAAQFDMPLSVRIAEMVAIIGSCFVGGKDLAPFPKAY